ncbi:MAG TPA: zf-HC2 domain-containing protein [Cellulomonas sp.]
MSQHLGSWASALADGQLDPAATERALAHVAGCTRCAGELAAARAARRALSAADDVRPAGDLTARLLALGCAPGGPVAGAAVRGPSRVAPFAPPAGRPATFTDTPITLSPHTSLLGGPGFALGALGGLGGQVAPSGPDGHGVLTGSVTPGRRGLRAVVGSVTGLGVVAVGLFVLGDSPDITPATGSDQALALLGSAGGTASVAVSATAGTDAPTAGSSTADFLAWMQAEGWTCPSAVPDGWSVTSVQLSDDDETLEVALSGPVGDLVLTEQQGQLDTDALAGSAQVVVADRTVYLLSTAPWHVAWQSGETVVEVVSSDGSADVASVVAEFPEVDFDSGLPARLTRGWDTLAAAVHLS